ncbi:MAG: 1-deoxy-D-xylulose-5-phosphate synthase [Actinomycetes bacterium]
MILPLIETPADLRGLSFEELDQLSQEIRSFIVETVTTTGGHLGSNLGVVELTLALHRVFDSPRDALLWDTGHQTYVHKLITGRRYGFKDLRKEGGLSGYPNRSESEHDWIENSHASTVLSYAHGLATAFELRGELAGHGGDRRVVAVVGDGALTGGMTYEALNNLGHSGRRVVIILNDNGRSYAPTISQLSQSLTSLRLNPTYVQARERLRGLLRDIPGVGEFAYTGVHGVTSALRELVAPHTFFEALGVRYAGPIDGHDIPAVEQALKNAAEWDGPIVVHVMTQKGRGYAPAEEDEVQRLHDFKVAPTPINTDDSSDRVRITTYTDAFSRALVREAENDDRIVALTAAMPGPTGLLPFQATFGERFIDVGIAEQHEMTSAAGMAMGGMKPVVCVYSTFFARAFDQAYYDVGMHQLPITVVLDRAGITGDDGASHHGVLDMALCLTIPNMAVFAPSSAEEVPVMLATALSLGGPAAIRYPKTPPVPVDGLVGEGLKARKLRTGSGQLCLLGVGKMVARCLDAAKILEAEGISATVYDVRVVSPIDERMLLDALDHDVVITVEDGTRVGGAGAFASDALTTIAAQNHRPTPSVRILGIPRAYLAQGRPDDILAELGLDGAGIASSSRRAMKNEAEPSSQARPITTRQPLTPLHHPQG